MNKQEFKLEGMSCHHCVVAVENELRDAGFENFDVKIGTANIEIDSSTENIEKIITAIDEAGYKVVN